MEFQVLKSKLEWNIFRTSIFILFFMSITHTNSGSFFQKFQKKFTFCSAHANKSAIQEKCFFLFLLTSAFGHSHPPTLSGNISIWSPPSTHLYAEVILEWSLSHCTIFLLFVLTNQLRLPLIIFSDQD